MEPQASLATVLVVEDDPLVRMDVAVTIQRAGFKAIEAANADEAVELLADHAAIKRPPGWADLALHFRPASRSRPRP